MALRGFSITSYMSKRTIGIKTLLLGCLSSCDGSVISHADPLPASLLAHGPAIVRRRAKVTSCHSIMYLLGCSWDYEIISIVKICFAQYGVDELDWLALTPTPLRSFCMNMNTNSGPVSITQYLWVRRWDWWGLVWPLGKKAF